MNVGINLPWRDYGSDLGRPLQTVSQARAAGGSAPPPSSKPLFAPGSDGYPTYLDQLFDSFQSLGIRCVRWFLLADGIQLAPPRLSQGQWDVSQPSIAATPLTRDWETILQIAVRRKMKLLPVYVDHRLFFPPAILLHHLDQPSGTVGNTDVIIRPGANSVDQFVSSFYKDPVQAPYQNDSLSTDWHQFVKCGRAPILRTPRQIDDFLAATLQPLLTLAANPAYKDQILAWDLINEPEVALMGWLNDKAMPAKKRTWWDPVQGSALAQFLDAGVRMIHAAGFPATTGFQTAMSLGQDDGVMSKRPARSDPFGKEVSKIADVVRTLSASPTFYPQWHYYPGGRSEQTTLVPAAKLGAPQGARTILGEFATLIPPGPSPWGSDIAPPDGVYARLKAVEAKGYDWAFPWSANPDAGFTDFSPAAQAQYQRYGVIAT